MEDPSLDPKKHHIFTAKWVNRGGGKRERDTVSPSLLHLSSLSAAFSVGRVLRRARERYRGEENAIFLSLAKYTPSGGITDRTSAGQEMIW